MAENVKVEINGDIDDQVRKFPVVKTASMDAAKKIAEVARSIAPVETGSYRDGIYAQATPSGGARVLASDNKSAWIEFGVPGHHRPARWVIRRAVEIAGFKFAKRKG